MFALKITRTVGQLKFKFEIITIYASSANCTKTLFKFTWAVFSALVP